MRYISIAIGITLAVVAASLAPAQTPGGRSARCCATAAAAAVASTAPEALPRYVLDATLDPVARTLDTKATVQVPESLAGQAVEFVLAAPLEIIESVPSVEKVAANAGSGFVGINGSSSPGTRSDRAARYRVQLSRRGSAASRCATAAASISASRRRSRNTRAASTRRRARSAKTACTLPAPRSGIPTSARHC